MKNKLILKPCQICGKTISKDNGNLDTSICNVCTERRTAEVQKKDLIRKNKENKKKKPPKARKKCDLMKIADYVSEYD